MFKFFKRKQQTKKEYKVLIVSVNPIKTFKEHISLMESFGKPFFVSYSRLEITANNTTTHFRDGNDPDSLRGCYYNEVVIDECYENNDYLINSVLKPTLVSSNGKFIVDRYNQKKQYVVLIDKETGKEISNSRVTGVVSGLGTYSHKISQDRNITTYYIYLEQNEYFTQIEKNLTNKE